MNQRPDFVDAEREFKRLRDEHPERDFRGEYALPP